MTVVGCGAVPTTPVFNPEDLAAIVQEQVVAQGRTGADAIEAVHAQLVDRYGVNIAPELKWLSNNGPGARSQFSVLYTSNNEYLIFVGSPAPAEWSLGPYDVEITDIVMDGALAEYPLGELTPTVHAPPEMVRLSGDGQEVRGYQIEQAAWLLEYGRGVIPSNLYGGALGQSTYALLPQTASSLATSLANSFIYNAVLQFLGLPLSSTGLGGYSGLGGYGGLLGT